MRSTPRRTFLKTSAGAAAAFALAPETAASLEAAPRLAAPIDVAVVGAGRQGRAILAELGKVEGVRVAAICDVVASRLSSGLRRAQGAKGYGTHQELLAQESTLGAVFVATPSHTHRDVAVAALEAGRHVYCESPLATTLEDARAIQAAARRSDRVFQTGMQGRSNPIYGLANSFLRSGAIRDVVLARAQHHKKTSWRTPASDPKDERALNWVLDPEVSLGLLGEFAVQQLDVVHWYLGAYPVSVRASGAVLLHEDGREVPDTVHAQFRFEDGRELDWVGTLGNSFDGTHELFCGTMGSIKLAWTAGWMFKEADAATQGWEVYANRQGFGNDQGITLIADATKLAEQDKLKDGVGLPEPPLYYPVVDFLKSATEGAPVVCSADEGLRAAAVGILAHRALVSGETVAIAPEDLKGA